MPRWRHNDENYIATAILLTLTGYSESKLVETMGEDTKMTDKAIEGTPKVERKGRRGRDTGYRHLLEAAAKRLDRLVAVGSSIKTRCFISTRTLLK
jgi:hypothetical protein